MNTEPEPEFDYQAYMRSLPLRGGEGGPDPFTIHRGPGARQERREAAKARLAQKGITTVAQFHARLAELEAEKRPFLYRGQPESDWPVNCSAARRLTGFAASPIENQLIEQLLVGYLEYLIGKARRRGLNPSMFDESATDLELMAHLQHQGAATGLIDFTRQPLAALWFACNGSNDKDGAVYVLPHSEAKETKHRDTPKKIQSFYGRNELRSWEPPVLGSRIVAQRSVFVFGVPAIPVHTMEKLIVPAASKGAILIELKSVYGISEEELFPDFPGYAVANSSEKAFDVHSTIDYWKEQIDTVSGGRKAWAHLMCGAAYSGVHNHWKAVEHYDEAIRLNPRFATAYTYRGNARNALGYHLEAIADFDSAIGIEPQLAEAHNNRGNAKAALGQREEAMADYDEAIRVAPQYAPAYNNRGVTKAELGRYEEAILDYDETLRIDSQYASAYNNRGNARGKLNQHYEAIKDCDKAIEINPQYAEAYRNRAKAKYALDRLEEAIADCDEAIRINPRDAGAYNKRGAAKGKLNLHHEAIEDYDKAIEINPDFAEAYNNRGVSKEELGQYKEAIADYDQAIRIHPRYDKAHANREIARGKLTQTLPAE